jgi:hypothetical protein
MELGPSRGNNYLWRSVRSVTELDLRDHVELGPSRGIMVKCAGGFEHGKKFD